MEWAPSGALLMVATTSPRLRVDNGLLILGLYGEHLHRHDMPVSKGERVCAPAKPICRLSVHCHGVLICMHAQVLLSAAWRPQTFAKPPQRPARQDGAANGASSRPAAPAIPKAAYVPPHLRDASGMPAVPVSPCNVTLPAAAHACHHICGLLAGVRHDDCVLCTETLKTC